MVSSAFEQFLIRGGDAGADRLSDGVCMDTSIDIQLRFPKNLNGQLRSQGLGQ